MPKLYFASPRDLAQTQTQPGVRRRLVPASHATVAVTELDPRTVVDSHRHDAEQAGVILKGSLAMVVAGEQRILTAGDTYNIPAGLAHGVRVFEEPTEILAIWAPPLDDVTNAAT